MLEFIDTHSHNADKAFEGCEDTIINNSIEAGVSTILQADIEKSEREAMYAICERWPKVLRPMLGLYPGSVKDNWTEEILALEAWYPKYKDRIVAIGEIGLDYYYGKETAELQKEALRVQLELASKWNLPVNIHLRDATEDFLNIIAECSHLGLKGNLHAFSGSPETFNRLSRYGDWYVGIGGVLTFKKASIAEDIKRIPLERIVLETDAPYLCPTPYRGKRNDSSYIPLIASFLAKQKEISLEEVAAVTTSNAKTLFNL